jgi:hypothetical protein
MTLAFAQASRFLEHAMYTKLHDVDQDAAYCNVADCSGLQSHEELSPMMLSYISDGFRSIQH